MAFGCIKGLALPLILLTLLAACQSGPSQRGYARTTALSPAGYGCGYSRCKPADYCPPGYILNRIPRANGGPGRYCAPYSSCRTRCCGAPIYGSSCGSGRSRY